VYDRSLSAGSGTSLQDLDLAGNFVRLEGAKILRAHIDASFPHLVSLSLANNDLQASGIDELCSCARLFGCLQSLKLGENGIDHSAASSVESLVQTATNLTSLDIDHAVLKSGYEPVFVALAQLPSLRSLR
jgi:hypothetical protein